MKAIVFEDCILSSFVLDQIQLSENKILPAVPDVAAAAAADCIHTAAWPEMGRMNTSEWTPLRLLYDAHCCLYRVKKIPDANTISEVEVIEIGMANHSSLPSLLGSVHADSSRRHSSRGAERRGVLDLSSCVELGLSIAYEKEKVIF
jgi:hypothetical protein